jgi:hypothetical protein
MGQWSRKCVASTRLFTSKGCIDFASGACSVHQLVVTSQDTTLKGVGSEMRVVEHAQTNIPIEYYSILGYLECSYMRDTCHTEEPLVPAARLT